MSVFNIYIYKGVGAIQWQIICCFVVKINTMELLYYSDRSMSLYKSNIRFLVSSRIILYLCHTRTYQNCSVKE